MASAKKHSQKELKGPDKFQMTVADWVGWLNKNKVTVAIVIGPFFAVALGIIGWQSYMEAGRSSRVDELGKIDSQYRTESEDANKQADKVRDEIGEIDAKIAKEKDDAKKKVLTTRKAELEKQVASIKPDHSGSMSRFQSYFDANSGTPEGWSAGVRAAAMLAERKDYAAAIKVLTAIESDANISDFYALHSGMLLAGIYEDSGALDKALATTISLQEKASDAIKPSLLFSKARIEMGLGKNEEARKTLTEITEKFATSQQADKARAMMALLAS